MTSLIANEKHVGVARLSALMFFQLFVFGAFGPVLSMYLQGTLRFSSGQAGFIMALSVVSSIAAPLLSVYVVDRLIRAKWLFILCHAVLATSAIGLFFARSFWPFLAAYLVNALFNGPAMGMLNAITFQRLNDIEGSGKNYGAVRVWGTLGWMGAGYLVSGLWAFLPAAFLGRPAASFQPVAFIVASIGSIMCMALALGLPPGSRSIGRKRELFPRDALAVMKRRSVIVLSIVYFASSIMDKLYSFGAAPYLASLGFSKALIPSILTLGQVSEIFMLFGLASILSRFSYKPVMLFGALVQAVRFALLWTGVPMLGLAGVAMNGIVFACIYSAILMYIDRRADAFSRQAVHQMIQLFIGGGSTLVGNLLAGALGRSVGGTGNADFGSYWVFALAGSVMMLLFLWMFFRDDTEKIRITKRIRE